MFENRDISAVPAECVTAGRQGKACGRNPDMYAAEKTDIGIVAEQHVIVGFELDGTLSSLSFALAFS